MNEARGFGVAGEPTENFRAYSPLGSPVFALRSVIGAAIGIVVGAEPRERAHRSRVSEFSLRRAQCMAELPLRHRLERRLLALRFGDYAGFCCRRLSCKRQRCAANQERYRDRNCRGDWFSMLGHSWQSN